LYVFQRVCEGFVRNVRAVEGKNRGYLKDQFVGDVSHHVKAGGVDEIACLDPPAARIARGKFGGRRLGIIEFSPEKASIRIEFVGVWGWSHT
jgi:hypothetical protein